MKIDFSQKIIGLDGKETDHTLGSVASLALNIPPENKLSFVDAVTRGNLAILISDNGEHEITPEDAALIRSLLPTAWAPIVVARAAKMLE